MSALTDPWFDSVDSIIGTSFRGSASDHGSMEYLVKGDSLYRISLWEQHLNSWPDFSTVNDKNSQRQRRLDSTHLQSIYRALPYKVRLRPHWYSRVKIVSDSLSFNVIDEQKRGWFHVRGKNKGWVRKSTIESASK